MEQLLKEIDYDISEEMKYIILFENLVWKSEFQYFQILKDLIPKLKKEWIQPFIVYVSQYNLLSYKFLGDLFAESGNLSINLTSNPYFCDYLYTRKLIKEEDLFYRFEGSIVKEISEYENPIKSGSLWDIIQRDDVNAFTSELETKEINLKLERISIFQTTIYLSEFIAYCGAINILKYMYLNNYKFNQFYCMKYAIQGGNEEIIEFFINKGYKFDNNFIQAIAFHQNKIAKWIFNTYNVAMPLKKCVETYNTEMLMFFMFNCECQQDLDTLNIDQLSQIASDINNVILFEYFKIFTEKKKSIEL